MSKEGPRWSGSISEWSAPNPWPLLVVKTQHQVPGQGVDDQRSTATMRGGSAILISCGGHGHLFSFHVLEVGNNVVPGLSQGGF